MTVGLGQSVFFATGWVPLSVSGTFVSVSSFTIPGDFTAFLQKGTKFLVTNSTKKYLVASQTPTFGAGVTTVNILVNTDHFLAAGAITNIFFSEIQRPFGWPVWFNCAVTWTGFTATVPTNVVARYRPMGTVIDYVVTCQTAGVSNATGLQVSIPVVAATITNMQWGCIPWFAMDNSAALATPCQGAINSAGTTVIVSKSLTGTGGLWTAANNKYVNFGISYEF